MGKRRNVLVLATLLIAASPGFAQAGKCDKDPDSYQSEKYSVRQVRIETPLEWLFGSVEEEIQDALSAPDMPIKEGQAFMKADFNRSFEILVKHFLELTVSRAERIRVRISRPGLANCDETTKSLDVVFHVYTFAFSHYLTRAFETGRKEEMKRSVVDTPATRRLADYFPQPFVGYNRSRAIFAGSKLSIRQGRLLDNIALEGSGSSSSAVALAEGSGFHDRGAGLIRHTEYLVRYFYSNLPGNGIKLRQGYGRGQFFGATRAFGASDLIVRFGGLVEGGNKLSDVAPSQVLTTNLASARFSSFKGFVGVNMRIGKHGQALKASYGLQLGSAGPGTHLDFTKQVFDSAANLRFPIGDHRSFTVDLELAGGLIHTRNELPVGERFFGGNAGQNFTSSDSFIIRSNPVIRSFPQNQFDRNSATGILGGDRFFSTNVTLAATLWRKPLVPSEIVDDDFNTAAEIGLNFAESTLKTEHLKETAEFKAMVEGIEPLSRALEAITLELNKVDTPALPQNVKDQLVLVREDASTAVETAAKVRKDAQEGSPKTGDIRKLVLGFPAVPVDSEISTVVIDAQVLSGMPGLAANQLNERIAELEAARKRMADSFNDLSKSTAEKSAGAKARQDMAYPRRVFYELVNDANLIAISPVALFDTARLWQRDISAGKFRFAFGPGVRLSIVSLDITAGYAWNANRQPWEGRGAFVISMQASNLFR